jgi:hypothetical protein
VDVACTCCLNSKFLKLAQKPFLRRPPPPSRPLSLPISIPAPHHHHHNLCHSLTHARAHQPCSKPHRPLHSAFSSHIRASLSTVEPLPPPPPPLSTLWNPCPLPLSLSPARPRQGCAPSAAPCVQGPPSTLRHLPPVCSGFWHHKPRHPHQNLRAQVGAQTAGAAAGEASARGGRGLIDGQ